MSTQWKTDARADMSRAARSEHNRAAWAQDRKSWSNQDTVAVRRAMKEARSQAPEVYKGDNPALCNAKTADGHFCRGLALPNGRCRWHGGSQNCPGHA